MRRASERHVNWQIVSIEATGAELRQSPLLYVASDRPLKLDEAEKARLKEFILQGGLLVCVNEGQTDEFARGIETLARELFGGYKFRDLPRDHPIYTSNFPVTMPTDPIKGLSNGVRELVVLYPTGDMSWKWQSSAGSFVPRTSPFASLANLHLYVTDRANPRFKGEDTWVERNPGAQTTRSARVARIKHDGNWDPEPAGWQRLANVMANFDSLDLKVEPTIQLKDVALAHLTSTTSIRLGGEVKNALRDYLNAGGLLLIDAADGAGFGGQEIKQVKYRRSQDLAAVNIPRLRGATVNNKLIAIISHEDISGGLVGYSTAGINGYAPVSATDLMRNMILWRAGAKK
jgi:hypothetical protein